MSTIQPAAKIILGLGNPGDRYRDTRHNCGFLVVGELARRWRIGFDQQDCGARLARGGKADLAMPDTYMNRSGYAARCLVDKWGYAPESMLVVFDEIDLPLGTLRLRAAGSPGGHRGLASIVENLRSSAIPRLRLGIAGAIPPPDLAQFVLAVFDTNERPLVDDAVMRAADACESWLELGIEPTMNRFNGPPPIVASDPGS